MCVLKIFKGLLVSSIFLRFNKNFETNSDNASTFSFMLLDWLDTSSIDVACDWIDCTVWVVSLAICVAVSETLDIEALTSSVAADTSWI